MKLAAALLVAGVLVFDVALAQATKITVLEHHRPIYPPSEVLKPSRVVLRVSVKEDGKIENVEVTTGSGSAALDQAAVDAIKTWRFAPATDDQGKPIAAASSFAITFRPPPRDLDLTITCAQVGQDVAALWAAKPDASLDQVPAIGALKDMADATAAKLPPEMGAKVLAALPGLYQDVLDACAKKPKATFMETYFAVTKVRK